jgi:hypothetical protein
VFISILKIVRTITGGYKISIATMQLFTKVDLKAKNDLEQIQQLLGEAIDQYMQVSETTVSPY